VEGGDALGVRRVSLDHPELVGERDRLADAGHGHTRAVGDVGVDHLPEVHAVHVVGADDHHDVGLLVADEVEALVDRVGRTREPALAEALLRGHRSDVGVEHAAQTPGLRHVAVERMALVLRQHDELPQPRVDEVREGEVDQPVPPREGHGGLRPVDGEGHQPLALAAREHDSEDLGGRHGPTLGERAAVP